MYHNIVFTILVHLFEHNNLRSLTLYQTGTLQVIFKIMLRCAMVLASGRTLSYNIGGLHFRPVYLDAGKGCPGTFYAR